MTFLLHVEFDATSKSVATMILECLAGMAAIVRRDHPNVYTYAFRYADETQTKLLFTELYADEQVFLDHGRDAEFGKLLQRGFDTTTGKSRKELCIRSDIFSPLSSITSRILDEYLHVTYLPVRQGFLYRPTMEKKTMALLMLGVGCDSYVYEQLKALVACVTCFTFDESNGNHQLMAVIVHILDEKPSPKDIKPSIDTIELLGDHQDAIQQFKDLLNCYFHVGSIRIQTDFSGYILHEKHLIE